MIVILVEISIKVFMKRNFVQHFLDLFSFVETPRKFIIAELSIRKLGSSSVLIIHNSIISTDEVRAYGS